MQDAVSGMRRRTRATLCWAVAALVLIQGGLRLAIDRWWPELRDPTFEIKARRLSRVVAQSPQPPVTVVMFGSSVTSNSFKAKDLEERLSRELGRPAAVVNMASHGAGPLTELLWTRRILQRGIRPNLVCIEFSPFLYDSPNQPIDTDHFPAPMLEESDLEVMERYGPDPELRRHREQDWWFPAYLHRLTILNYLATPLVPVQDRIPTWGGTIDERFWTALEPRDPEELAEALAHVKKEFKDELNHFAPGVSSLEALEELLGLLHKEGIPALVILAPEGPTLRSLYLREPLDRLVNGVRELARQYDATFLDAFDWLDESMFGDSIHPNTIGAEVFSNRLVGEALLPILGCN
jgi:hypothetical protein